MRFRGARLTAAPCLFVALAGWSVATMSVVGAQTRIPAAQVAPPGDTGRRITDEGLLANYFPATGKAPAVLMLGGSEGGLGPDWVNVAKALQSEGFSVLQLSYFRAPGQNSRLELIPLEYFATALSWLRRQPEVDPAKVAIVGVSKGAEAALLLAIRNPDVKAVIAALPSSVVWPGIVWEGTTAQIGSSWSEQGKPLPHLPHVPYDASKGGTMADNFSASLAAFPQHPAAIIPVERIAGRMLLVCGEDDRTSPGCPMARQIEQRLREHRRPAPTLLAYKDAGHPSFGLPLPPDHPRLTSAGGTAEGTNAARADSWQKALAFLKATVPPAGVPPAQSPRPPPLDAPPGETGRRITENGLVANYFPARRRGPAVLTLGGSVGGLTMNDVSIALQAEGISVLHLSFFRGPGQTANAEMIPVEYFATALAWLQRQPEVDPARLGIVGVSKGAEAALVVAVRHPELKAVVAALPSSVVWPGIIWEAKSGPIASSWSEQEKPVPHLPHAPYDASKGGTMADNYSASLKALSLHPESVIPVERIAGRLFLVCGEDDQIWPSCPMARQIQDRLRARGRPAATLLAYDAAGHMAFGLPLPPGDPRIARSGGTESGNRTARADSWSKFLEFLKSTLQN